MNFLIGKYSDKGIKKEVNQDAIMIKTAKTPLGRVGLFAVADGMGGLASGELASATMIQYLSQWFENKVLTIDLNNDKENTILSITEIINEVNNRIVNYGAEKNTVLGTTATILLTIDRQFFIAHVGDSRIYKIDNNINVLTEDHTLVAREVKRGNMTKEEAKKDKRRNILLQCVGGKNGVDPQILEGELLEDEIYILCSDGFYKKFDDSEILKEVSSRSLNTSKALDQLVENISKKAMQRKEVDNISAIVIKTIN